jgi:Cu-processing system permease protein
VTDGARIVARLALREAARRRVLAVIVALTVAFVVLYWFGARELFSTIDEIDATGVLDARSLAGATFLGLAMFATLFLGTVLAVFLTHGAVRGDAERGLLQPLVVRPLSRAAYLVGRLAAAVLVSGAYVVVTFSAAVLITGLVGGWWPDDPEGAALRLVLATTCVCALGLLGSVLLGATATGIAVLMAFGAGLVAGLLGAIGEALGSGTLVDVADVMSWVLPFEGLYRDALQRLVADAAGGGVTETLVQLGPLGGSKPAGPLFLPYVAAWLAAVVGLAAWRFGRRDL